ncbi:MAG TPA: toprim domain-containing protein [Burkholderiales bacterium]
MHEVALLRVGIALRHSGVGTQRIACPQCLAAKHRPRDTALALTIEGDGHAVWFCHRCAFKGSTARQADPLPRAEVIRLAEVRAKLERERQADKAVRARAIWQAARAAPADHRYLARKHLVLPAGLRLVDRFQSLAGGVLLVPMRDASGDIVNLQGISSDGEKRFLAGAKTRGAFCCVGPWHRGEVRERIAVGEGWATVAAFRAFYAAFLGVAAMSASNLPDVARVMRQKFPRAEIVIAADPDRPGMLAAGEAAAAVNAEIRLPGIAERGGDWSDAWIANHGG